MQFLVTGGAGFIGSALVDRLLRQGHLVTVVDDFSRGRRANLEAALVAYGQALRVVALDIRDPGLSGVVAQAQPDVVFHLAAQIDVRASVANPANDADVNILGTINLAQAACAAGVRKIVSSSGGSIYGDTPELPATETTALQPLSAYAVAKVAAELYLKYVLQVVRSPVQPSGLRQRLRAAPGPTWRGRGCGHLCAGHVRRGTDPAFG